MSFLPICFSGCSERLEIGEAFHWRLEDFQGSIQLSKESLRKKSTDRLSNFKTRKCLAQKADEYEVLLHLKAHIIQIILVYEINKPGALDVQLKIHFCNWILLQGNLRTGLFILTSSTYKKNIYPLLFTGTCYWWGTIATSSPINNQKNMFWELWRMASVFKHVREECFVNTFSPLTNVNNGRNQRWKKSNIKRWKTFSINGVNLGHSNSHYRGCDKEQSLSISRRGFT